MPNIDLIVEKIRIIEKILEEYPELEEYVEDLVNDYEEISPSDLDIIIDHVQDKVEEVEIIQDEKDKLKEKLEEIAQADEERVKEIEEELGLNKEVEEEPVQEEQPVEEQQAEIESANNSIDNNIQENYPIVDFAGSHGLYAEMIPEKDSPYEVSTFRVEVSPSSQLAISALIAQSRFGAFTCAFEITRSGNYVLNLMSAYKNNPQELESMLKNIEDAILNADKLKMSGKDPLEFCSADLRNMQNDFENKNPLAKEIYEKRDDPDFARTVPRLGEERLEINKGAYEGTLAVGQGPVAGINDLYGEGGYIKSGTQQDLGRQTGLSVDDNAPVPVEAVQKGRQYTYKSDKGEVNLAMLIMGVGVAAGLIALFIIMA